VAWGFGVRVKGFGLFVELTSHSSYKMAIYCFFFVYLVVCWILGLFLGCLFIYWFVRWLVEKTSH